MRDFFYMPNGFKRGHRGQACILGYCTGTELVVPLGTDHPPRRCKLHISTYLGGGFGMAVVLVVEDEPQVLVLAESCLREHGHKTLSAGSVTQASALLENNDKIDLLFTDIGLKDDLEAGLHLAPVQKPHPPIIIGGGFPHAAKRAIAYGDGWMPIGGRADPLEVLPQFRELAQDAGRDPASLSICVFGAPSDLEILKRYRDAGIDRVVLGLPSTSRDEVLPILDRSAALVRGL